MFCLERASDIFQARYETIMREQMEQHGRTEEEAHRHTERQVDYTNTFYVLSRARRPHLCDKVHQNVGDKLNKALTAMEESNRTLDGMTQSRDVYVRL